MNPHTHHDDKKRKRQTKHNDEEEQNQQSLESEHDEDRISQLPDSLLSQILSLSAMDAHTAVRFCLLVSKRWNRVWVSLTHLYFNSHDFRNQSKFSRFVTGFFSNRSAHGGGDEEIPVISYTDRGSSLTHALVRKIAKFGESNRTQKLSIVISEYVASNKWPSSLFGSPFLKQLTLHRIRLEWSLWDLPNLTHLNLSDVDIDVGTGILSGLTSLKHLCLIECRTAPVSGKEGFHVGSPTLETLCIDNLSYGCRFVVSTPRLSSFYLRCQASLDQKYGSLWRIRILDDSIGRSFREAKEDVKQQLLMSKCQFEETEIWMNRRFVQQGQCEWETEINMAMPDD